MRDSDRVAPRSKVTKSMRTVLSTPCWPSSLPLNTPSPLSYQPRKAPPSTSVPRVAASALLPQPVATSVCPPVALTKLRPE